MKRFTYKNFVFGTFLYLLFYGLFYYGLLYYGLSLSSEDFLWLGGLGVVDGERGGVADGGRGGVADGERGGVADGERGEVVDGGRVRVVDGEEGRVLDSDRVRVVSGDSLVVGERRLRLEGIDAPERDQVCCKGEENWSCGERVREILRSFIDKGMFCRSKGVDRDDSMIVECYRGEDSVNEWMVKEGWAFAYTGKGSTVDYLPQQRSAKAQKKGLWESSLRHPRIWGGLSEGQKERYTCRKN